MLPKKPESTNSRPVMSRVQEFIKSLLTTPMCVRRSKMFQLSWPRMRKEAAGIEQRVTLARDGFDQRRFAATVRAEYRDVFAGVDREAEPVEHQAVAALHGDVGEF